MRPLDILVVDDDRDLAEAIGDALEIAGHRPVLAFSGTEAIEQYCNRRFDITFMDVKLPDINGVETFATIRKMAPDARVVMMTGYRIDQLLAEAIDQGAIKVLRKPFAMDDILSTLREVLPAGMILVADDDPDFAHAIGLLLEEHGHRVIVARTGREAVDKVMTSAIDILILDLRLPVMHGLDVYLTLRDRGRAVPTIVVTGFAKEESEKIDSFKALSVTGCLFKPFEPTQLLQIVEAIGHGSEVK